MANDLVNHDYVMMPPEKTQEDLLIFFWRASTWRERECSHVPLSLTPKLQGDRSSFVLDLSHVSFHLPVYLYSLLYPLVH